MNTINATTPRRANKDKRTASNGVTLQHRHFSFIAATIADLDDDGIREHIADHFAHHLTGTNANFDRDRFMIACEADRKRIK